MWVWLQKKMSLFVHLRVKCHNVFNLILKWPRKKKWEKKEKQMWQNIDNWWVIYQLFIILFFRFNTFSKQKFEGIFFSIFTSWPGRLQNLSDIIFVKGKSCLTEILDFFNVTNKYLGKWKSIADLYLRFYEAFDKSPY